MTTPMIWTTAGFAALVNADNTGTLPVECKYIALGTGTTAASAADTALESEIKRIQTISGTVVDNNVIHVVLRDETSDTYQVTEVGLIAADGTLLARYAQANPLIVKAAGAVALLAIDASFTDVDATQISFGDIQFINPPWGENTQGVVQKATQAQAEDAEDNTRGMTPRRTLELIRSVLPQLGYPLCMSFTEVAALSEDQGPIICSDMAGMLYTWQETEYFTGYRSAFCGEWRGGIADTPLAWQLLAAGGTWTESNLKHKRVISRYQELGRVSASPAVGDNLIKDLGSGQWQAPDLRDVFQRMSGSRSVGLYQQDSLQNITGSFLVRPRYSPGFSTFVAYQGSGVFSVKFNEEGETQTPVNGNMPSDSSISGVQKVSIDASRNARTSNETRPKNTTALPVIII